MLQYQYVTKIKDVTDTEYLSITLFETVEFVHGVEDVYYYLWISNTINRV